MAKDPAFLFYSNDFLTGTMTMSFEDRGKYITILSLMHQQGRLKEETICFLVGIVSVSLKSKFQIDENGFWYNERLEIETEKRNKFTESRRINGSKGGRQKISENHMDKHMQNHKGTHIEDVNYSINNINKKESEISNSNGTWEDEKKYFLADEQWQYKICTSLKMSKDELGKKIKEFLEWVELKDDYKSAKELKSHFINWINKKKSVEPTDPTKVKIKLPSSPQPKYD